MMDVDHDREHEHDRGQPHRDENDGPTAFSEHDQVVAPPGRLTPSRKRFNPYERPSNYRDSRRRQVRGYQSERAPTRPIRRERKPLDDPFGLDYVVSFQYFNEWYHQNKEGPEPEDKEDMHKRYDDYCNEKTVHVAKNFIKANREQAWFCEKYGPLSDRVMAELGKYRNWLQELFMRDLESGKFDSINADLAVAKDSNAESQDTTLPPKVVAPGTTAEDELLSRPVPLVMSILPNLERTIIAEALKNYESIKYLALSEPSPMKGFFRIGWIVLDRDEAEKIVSEVKGNIQVAVGSWTHTVQCKVQTLPSNTQRRPLFPDYSTPDRLRTAFEFLRKLCEKFDSEVGLESASPSLLSRAQMVCKSEEKEEGEDMEVDGVGDLDVIKKYNDLAVEYLRRVHNFCFYCACKYDSIYELSRHCIAGHVRTPAFSSMPAQFNETMLNKWDDRIQKILDPAKSEYRDVFKINVDETVQSELKKNFKEEAPERYRCTVGTCTKLFKSEDFVLKHIEKRHSEIIPEIRSEIEILLKYAADAFRITPSNTPGLQMDFVSMEAAMEPFGLSPAAMMMNVPGMPPLMPQMMMNMANGLPLPPRAAIQEPNGRSDSRANNNSTRQVESRSLRSYKDLDAPTEETPELDY